MTDSAIAAEIGRRLEQLRLERNLTQQQVADAVGISRVSYGKLARGEGKFVNMVGVLRALDCLPLLESFIPEVGFSPMALLEMQGKQRQRARPQASAAGQQDEGETGGEALDW
ncbi:helix-turn-helix transcriptional regulator [Pseudomaricurvus sp. HS19]|uniref:helix-turn-helix transcriptional regulator n=1 Tax=Pseudomaricurvus sp. HS19 TaxID=2692626 RepID=UPI001F31F37E|nr:helix-turn-helix transcriptional regulator [Pseudomaricurvus sp. HS19]